MADELKPVSKAQDVSSRIRLYSAWRDGQGEMNNAPFEAADLLDQMADALTDPNAVHVNMLAGHIAKPSIDQIVHIYGADALRAAVSAWQDIASAPRDGTEVLVLIRPKVIRLGWYFVRSSRTEGWCDENGRAIKPTHWQPQPTPPVGEQ